MWLCHLWAFYHQMLVIKLMQFQEYCLRHTHYQISTHLRVTKGNVKKQVLHINIILALENELWLPLA